VDFVVIIDISASMKLDSKLAFVQATIEYLLEILDDHHRFSLIVFNHSISLLSELIHTTAANKVKILELVRGLQASGSTNISEALFQGINILAKRQSKEQSRISTIMLFTDGLSNRGLSTRATLETLGQMQLPEGCVINTFGFGSDHDSKMLHAIALRSKGVYYYVESQDDIAATFGECVAGILSTEAYNIVVKMRGLDGGRIVTLATPYPVKELKVAKDYDIQLGLIYSGESKSLLFKLSLRKMKDPMLAHNLASITVEYINSRTGMLEIQEKLIQIARPATSYPNPIPLELDQHINRYAAAVAITESIELSKRQNFTEAQQKLSSLISRIQKSASAQKTYCEDLIKDLRACMNGMSDPKSFSTGIHSAHAYSAMYYMERSTGSKNLNKKSSDQRSSGYGYVTEQQEKVSRDARNKVNPSPVNQGYVGGYVLQ